jgi:WD40 repeat protein
LFVRRYREKLSKSRIPALIVCLAALVCFHALAVSSDDPVVRKIYIYRNDELFQQGRIAGNIEAKLDPSSKYLYLIDLEKARVLVIDWRKDTLIKTASLADLPCVWYNPEAYKNYPEKPILLWQFLPHTNLLFVVHCETQLLLDARTFQVIRTVMNPLRERGSVVFSAAGDLALVTRIERQSERRTVELRRVQTWEIVAHWPSDIDTEAFTPDGKYIVELPEGGNGCTMNFYEVPSGKLSNQWTQDGENALCPGKPLLFLNKPPYRLALAQGVVGEYIISLWDTWTGKHVRRIRVAPYTLATRPSVSANGRYVVAGTWNDPQDNPISAGFTIWNVDSGEVVYRTPTYKSTWGPNTVGEEVYPSFSQDGKYLVTVSPEGVRIYEIAAELK